MAPEDTDSKESAKHKLKSSWSPPKGGSSPDPSAARPADLAAGPTKLNGKSPDKGSAKPVLVPASMQSTTQNDSLRKELQLREQEIVMLRRDADQRSLLVEALENEAFEKGEAIMGLRSQLVEGEKGSPAPGGGANKQKDLERMRAELHEKESLIAALKQRVADDEKILQSFMNKTVPGHQEEQLAQIAKESKIAKEEVVKLKLENQRLREAAASGSPLKLAGGAEFLTFSAESTQANAGNEDVKQLRAELTVAREKISHLSEELDIKNIVHAKNRDEKQGLDGEVVRLRKELEEQRAKGGAAPAPGTVPTDEEMAACWMAFQNSKSRTGWLIISKQPQEPPERPFTARNLVMEPFHQHGHRHLANCKVGAMNIKGQTCQGDEDVGQDNVSIATFKDNRYSWQVCCVADGHGSNGHFVSQWCCKALPYYLSYGTACSALMEQDKVELALVRAFQQCQNDLVQLAEAKGLDILTSGSTAIVMLGKQGTPSVWVAHVGDTRAMLLDANGVVVMASQDHKPSLESESTRVHENGGEIRSTTFKDGYTVKRVAVPGCQNLNLHTTRSFGDLAFKRHGVIAVPQVEVWDCSSLRSASWILAASDGVWEFMENNEVAKLVGNCLNSGQSPQQTVEELVHVAKGKWQKNEGIACDDITAVLCPVQGAAVGPPSASAKGKPDNTDCLGGVAQKLWRSESPKAKKKK